MEKNFQFRKNLLSKKSSGLVEISFDIPGEKKCQTSKNISPEKEGHLKKSLFLSKKTVLPQEVLVDMYFPISTIFLRKIAKSPTIIFRSASQNICWKIFSRKVFYFSSGSSSG